MDIFLDMQATKNAVIEGGIAIFEYIYNARGTTLGKIRYNVFSSKAAGLIKAETLPSTDREAAQNSIHAYLQTCDWMLLQSMFVDPIEYGWTIGIDGFEPVLTLDSMAPGGIAPVHNLQLSWTL